MNAADNGNCSHHSTKIHTTLLKQICAGLIDFLQSTLHQDAIKNNCSRPWWSNYEKDILSGLFATDVDAVSIDVLLSVLILGFFTIIYPFYAHLIYQSNSTKLTYEMTSNFRSSAWDWACK